MYVCMFEIECVCVCGTVCQSIYVCVFTFCVCVCVSVHAYVCILHVFVCLCVWILSASLLAYVCVHVRVCKCVRAVFPNPVSLTHIRTSITRLSPLIPVLLRSPSLFVLTISAWETPRYADTLGCLWFAAPRWITVVCKWLVLHCAQPAVLKSMFVQQAWGGPPLKGKSLGPGPLKTLGVSIASGSLERVFPFPLYYFCVCVCVCVCLCVHVFVCVRLSH